MVEGSMVMVAAMLSGATAVLLGVCAYLLPWSRWRVLAGVSGVLYFAGALWTIHHQLVTQRALVTLAWMAVVAGYAVYDLWRKRAVLR